MHIAAKLCEPFKGTDGAGTTDLNGQVERSVSPRLRRTILWISGDGVTPPIVASLEEAELSVQILGHRDERLSAAPNDDFCCVVLDICTQDKSSLLMARQFVALNIAPTLWISTSEDNCLSGIELGAADFLLKPFSQPELLLRVRALVRRFELRQPSSESLKRCGALKANLSTREAWLHDSPLVLTSSEFTILETLLQEPCRIVSRDKLAMALYQRQASPLERSIDVHICNLRKKIEKYGTFEFVR
ncbi:MAG TPA: response regulator transcription factor [Bryobacteraceae bacterium]|jgi:two-component system response regulator CpxR|nr:response regulator transcription factor [Bryobacteraceae bacterium]